MRGQMVSTMYNLKNYALYLSVNVFSMKVLINYWGHYILRHLLLETGPPFYVVI